MACRRQIPEDTKTVSQTHLIQSFPPTDTEAESPGLKQELGLASGISMIVGTMIGSGVFASPKWVIMYAGSVGLTLCVWSLCGILSVFGALCYIELGLLIPKSGGEYVYMKEAFGDLAGFLFSWTQVLVYRPSSFAIILLAFAFYVLEPFFPGCTGRQEFEPIVKLLAAAAIGECWGKEQKNPEKITWNYAESKVSRKVARRSESD